MRTLVTMAFLLATTSVYAQVADPNAGNQELALQRYAIGGRKSLLGTAYSLKMDCSPVDWQIVTVTKSPDHGELKVIENFDTFAFFNAPNPRAKCNGEKVKATALEYSPTKDYTGEDSTVVEIVTESGYRQLWKFTILVK